MVVTFHGGAEGADKQHVKPGTEMFLGENRGNLMKFSHAVVDAGADLVVGHGPHVLRGMEWRKGRLIAYSLGNFAGHGSLNWDGVLGVSALLRVTLRGDGAWVQGKIVPVRIERRAQARLEQGGAEVDPQPLAGRLRVTGARIRQTDGRIRAPS